MSELRQVFISWSGTVSRKMATIIYDSIQALDCHCMGLNLKPWFSGDDIASGSLWRDQIKDNAQASSFGVVCFTNCNLSSPWMMYEIGLMHSKLAASNIIPVAYNVASPAACLPSVISDRQCSTFNVNGVRDVLKRLSNSIVDNKQFDVWWQVYEPGLRAELTALSSFRETGFQASAVASLCWFGHDLMWALSKTVQDKDAWVIYHGLEHLMHQAELAGISALSARAREHLIRIEAIARRIEQTCVTVENDMITAIKTGVKLSPETHAELEEALRSLRDGVRYQLNDRQPGYSSHRKRFELTRRMLMSEREI